MIMVILVPQFLGFCSSLWSSCYKARHNDPRPSLIAMFWILIGALFESSGMSLFVLVVAPRINAVLCLTCMNGVFVLPALQRCLNIGTLKWHGTLTKTPQYIFLGPLTFHFIVGSILALKWLATCQPVPAFPAFSCMYIYIGEHGDAYNSANTRVACALCTLNFNFNVRAHTTYPHLRIALPCNIATFPGSGWGLVASRNGVFINGPDMIDPSVSGESAPLLHGGARAGSTYNQAHGSGSHGKTAAAAAAVAKEVAAAEAGPIERFLLWSSFLIQVGGLVGIPFFLKGSGAELMESALSAAALLMISIAWLPALQDRMVTPADRNHPMTARTQASVLGHFLRIVFTISWLFVLVKYEEKVCCMVLIIIIIIIIIIILLL